MLPSKGPVCPNHGEPLEGLPFPLQSKGTGKCPVSGVSFDYEVDLDEESMEDVQDKFGKLTKQPVWKVMGDD